MIYSFIFRWCLLGGKVVYYEVLRHNLKANTYLYIHNSVFFCHAVKALNRGKLNDSGK